MPGRVCLDYANNRFNICRIQESTLYPSTFQIYLLLGFKPLRPVSTPPSPVLLEVTYGYVPASTSNYVAEI